MSVQEMLGCRNGRLPTTFPKTQRLNPLVSKLCSKLCSPGPPRRHKAGWAPPSFTANNSAHLCFIHVALHGILFEITRGAAKFFGFSFNLSFGSNFKLQKLQK